MHEETELLAKLAVRGALGMELVNGLLDLMIERGIISNEEVNDLFEKSKEKVARRLAQPDGPE